MTIANYVTLGRLLLIPLLVVLLLFQINGLGVALFLLLSFSDAVDGWIARKYNQVSDLGKFLDPLADKVLVTSALIVLVGVGQADTVAVLILIAREFIVQGIRINEARYQRIIAASPVAKWKTGTQVAAVAMLILNLPFAGAVLWLSVAFSLLSGGAYLWESKILKQLKLN